MTVIIPFRADPLRWVAGMLLGLGACAVPTPTDPGPFQGPLVVPHSDVRVFLDVHVVDPATGTTAGGQAVLVREGRIERVGPANALAVPPGSDDVDGAGAWLMPGLVDMHVHMNASEAESYVRSGVTSVRNMWGFRGLEDIRGRLADGTLVGPRIHSLSPGLDGPPMHWPETELITDPATADSVVSMLAARGYGELKIYQDLSLDVYDAGVSAALERGLTWAGHKPTPVPLEHVIGSGRRSIEHLGGLRVDGAELDGAIALMVRHGTWVCPTLGIQSRLAGGAGGESRRRDVARALYDGGVRLLVGTDAGIGVTEAGASLVEEMARLRDATKTVVPAADAGRPISVDTNLRRTGQDPPRRERRRRREA